MGVISPLYNNISNNNSNNNNTSCDTDKEFGRIVDLLEMSTDATTTATISSVTSGSSDSTNTIRSGRTTKATTIQEKISTMLRTIETKQQGDDTNRLDLQGIKEQVEELQKMIPSMDLSNSSSTRDETSGRPGNESSSSSPDRPEPNPIREIAERARARRKRLERFEEKTQPCPPYSISSGTGSGTTHSLFDYIQATTPGVFRATSHKTPRDCSRYHPRSPYSPPTHYAPSTHSFPNGLPNSRNNYPEYYTYSPAAAYQTCQFFPGDYGFHPMAVLQTKKNRPKSSSSSPVDPSIPKVVVSRKEESLPSVPPPNHRNTKDPLSAAMLATLSPHDQKEAIGERLYDTIAESHPESLAGRITGILLESEDNCYELLNLLESPEVVEKKIEEVLAFLNSYR